MQIGASADDLADLSVLYDKKAYFLFMSTTSAACQVSVWAERRPVAMRVGSAKISSAMAKKVLMVCSGNLDRSPTAAMLLAEMCAPMWVTSAGIERWARNQVSPELLAESDVVLVMEEAHHRSIRERFGDEHAQKVIVLHVPDNYVCWDAELISILKPKLRAALGLPTRQQH